MIIRKLPRKIFIPTRARKVKKNPLRDQCLI